MEDIGLKEVWIIARSIAIGLASIYVVWAAWEYRAPLIAITRALWLRYVARVSFAGLLAMVEDRPISPLPETGNDPVPPHSDAGNDDGNDVSVSSDDLLISRLAALVLAGKLDQSAAIKIGLQAPTGRAYMAAKARLEAELERQRFPTLTDAGRPVRMRTVAR